MSEETYCLLDGEGIWWSSQDGEDWTTAQAIENGYSFVTYALTELVDTYGLATHDTRPDAEADGYAWPSLAQGSTIAHDAHEVVYGRGDNYGHPRDNHTRIAQLWTALLSDHLQDGAYITPEDVARCMVAMKLARDVTHPKRDNRVDGIGYFIALDRMATGQ